MSPSGPARTAASLNTQLDRLSRVGAWLVLPLSALLFLQWPLRDWVGAGSRPANDLAQWVFALYVALALRTTTREHAHLALGERDGAAAPSAWRRCALRWTAAASVLPWALFVLVSAAPLVWQSVRGLESFPDTLNPLYFVIKLSVWLMAALMAVQAVLDLMFDAQADAQSERTESTE